MSRFIALLILMFALSPTFSSAQPGPEPADPELSDAQDPYMLLGKGSTLEQTRDIYFGLSREKKYCDGKEVGFFGYLMSSVCCTIRINSLDVSDEVQLALTARTRRIKYIDGKLKYAAITSDKLTTIACGSSAPSKYLLETAFGDLIRVKEFYPVDKQKMLKQNINYEASPASTQIINL